MNNISKFLVVYVFSKFDSTNGGFIGDYLGIPTIEIEGMKSMIKDPEKKRQFRIPFNINNIPITAFVGVILSILFIYRFFNWI